MKRNTKRILALLMSAVLLLTGSWVTVAAEDAEPYTLEYYDNPTLNSPVLIVTYGNEYTSVSDAQNRVRYSFTDSDGIEVGCMMSVDNWTRQIFEQDGKLYPQFREKGAVVLGISKDSVASHKKFEEKYGLPFLLLSDPEKEVIRAYDVWKEKKNYGKVTMGVIRTTYLIDEDGVIERAFDQVRAAENPAQMLRELQ